MAAFSWESRQRCSRIVQPHWASFLLAFSAPLPLVNPLGLALVFLGLMGESQANVYRSMARSIANDAIHIAMHRRTHRVEWISDASAIGDSPLRTAQDKSYSALSRSYKNSTELDGMTLLPELVLGGNGSVPSDQWLQFLENGGE